MRAVAVDFKQMGLQVVFLLTLCLFVAQWLTDVDRDETQKDKEKRPVAVSLSFYGLLC